MKKAENLVEFAVLSYDEADAYEIAARLKAKSNWRITWTPTIEAAAFESGHKKLNGVVWSLLGQKLEILENISKLRLHQKELPVVVVSDSQPAALLKQVDGVKQIALVERKTQTDQLARICSKIIAGELLIPRQYRRYPADVSAILRRVDEDIEVKGRMINVSRGGAYIKVPRRVLNEGEIVEACINLSEVSRSHRIFAEVVWASSGKASEFGGALGLKFMNAEAIYSRYLKGAT